MLRLIQSVSAQSGAAPGGNEMELEKIKEEDVSVDKVTMIYSPREGSNNQFKPPSSRNDQELT